jgi:hypothetical protein
MGTLGGEATIPYFARLLGIAMNNNTIPGDWKTLIVVHSYKLGGGGGGCRSVSWKL